MHVLHLIKTSEGAAWAINLLRAIKLKYPEIQYSVIIPKGGRFFSQYEEICDNVVDFDYEINRSIFSKGRVLKEIVKNLNPDIIHSWFTQTTLYSRLFLRNFKQPKIFQVVGPAHLEIKIFKLGDIWSSSKRDYWIATSKYIYNHYKDSDISTDRLFLNYAFIDTEIFLSQANSITQRNLRKEFNIAAGTKIIGTASYLYPPKFFQSTGIKGHEILLDAFKVLLARRDDIVLVISGGMFKGDSTYLNKLKAEAAAISKEKIIFTGIYKHVNEVMSNFDVFVYLSTSENLGGVYESLLLQIPTVSSDRGALPELVINEQTGYNVVLDDPALIAEKIELILTDENQFKEAGKNKVESTFNKEKIIDETYRIYKTILKNTKRV